MVTLDLQGCADRSRDLLDNFESFRALMGNDTESVALENTGLFPGDLPQGVAKELLMIE